LRAFLLASFALGRQVPAHRGIAQADGQAQIDPEFWQRFRNAFLQRRRDALGIIVDRTGPWRRSLELVGHHDIA